ncbi:hypothetical protein JCM1840_003342 [Sporobolomyces johnsonii]
MQPSVARRALSDILKKRPDDVVFVTSLRTPIGKFRGGLKDMHAEELLSHVLRATKERLEGMGVDVNGGAVEDIHNGTVLMELGGAKSGRLASLDAGFPVQTGFKSVNRQCASSLQSVTDIAISIQSGLIDMGIASGAESMTKDYGTRAIPAGISPYIKNSWSQDAQDCLAPMGTTSEAVAEKYNISRERQDEFAVQSHAKAKKAQDAGLLAEEIVPMKVRKVTPAEGDKPEIVEEVVIEKDEGIRPQTTMESLAKLKTVFKENGTGTAGNSSQISDGASAMTLVRRDVAEKLGLKPIAKWVGSAVVGVPPIIMGVGPAYAVPKLFQRFGITKDDVDIFELNEAFASQSLMVIDTLGLDVSKVNPKGGAIALGHPLGATGGRLLSSLIYELRRTEKKVGVTTLCMGTGAGKATLIVNEQASVRGCKRRQSQPEAAKQARRSVLSRLHQVFREQPHASVSPANVQVMAGASPSSTSGQAKGQDPPKDVDQPGPRFHFGFLPIPKRCRYDPERPFRFSSTLNWMLAATSTLTVANVYYCQPILTQLSERYDVSYDRVTRTVTLIQAGYLMGLVFITPLGDLVPRRPLLLLLTFLTATLALGQATVTTFAGFEALCFVIGLFTVTPQILNPLAADLAPPEKRASAVSIVVSGLIGGMVVGRVMSGILDRFTHWPNHVFFFASSTQYLLLLVLYLFLPDYPKKRTGLSYFGILWGMVKLFFTQPVLMQACFVGCAACAIFVSWWTTLTFLLSGSPFNYDTFEVGLFGLAGVCALAWAPFAGRLVDRLAPFLVTLLALCAQMCTQSIAIGAAGLNLGPVIVVCMLVDACHQTVQISNQTRIFSIDPLSRGRLNGVFTSAVFAGQAMGSSVGPKIFLRYGWRACYALHLGWNAAAILFLLARGPNSKGWVGWGGNYSLRKVPKRSLGKTTDAEKAEQGKPKNDGAENEEKVGEETVVDRFSVDDRPPAEIDAEALKKQDCLS